MKLDISICSTNLLTQKQKQELADLTAVCSRHDDTDLSFPIEEDDLSCVLGYLPDSRLVSCLALIPYEETLAECCAFTHPDFRRQGCFSELLSEALSLYPDVDLLFAVSENCPDTLNTLKALDAEKNSEEHLMECSLSSFRSCSEGRSTEPFSIKPRSKTEYTFYHSDIPCGGICIEAVEKTVVCLHHVEIFPEFRNRGFGTALLQLFLPILIQKGFEKAILQVTGDNAPALALYKKTGFSVTKTLSYYLY